MNISDKWKGYTKFSSGNIPELDSTRFEQISFNSDSSKLTINYKFKPYSSSDLDVLENQGKLFVFPSNSEKSTTLVIASAKVERNGSTKSFEDLRFEFETPVFIEKR